MSNAEAQKFNTPAEVELEIFTSADYPQSAPDLVQMTIRLQFSYLLTAFALGLALFGSTVFFSNYVPVVFAFLISAAIGAVSGFFMMKSQKKTAQREYLKEREQRENGVKEVLTSLKASGWTMITPEAKVLYYEAGDFTNPEGVGYYLVSIDFQDEKMVLSFILNDEELLKNVPGFYAQVSNAYKKNLEDNLSESLDRVSFDHFFKGVKNPPEYIS